MENLQHPDITAAERTGYPRGREPEVFAQCEYCGDDIYIGEDYYDIHGYKYCWHCMQNYCLKEAM